MTVAVVALAGLSTLALGVTTGGVQRHNAAYGAIRCSPPALPRPVVNVVLSDMGGGGMMGGGQLTMASLGSEPHSVPAGSVSIVARNVGGLVHEVVVLPLPEGGPGTRKVGIDNKIDESASLGEASKSCRAGTGDGLAPGSTGWVTLTLRPGRYELVCDEPGHYAAGMFDVLTVR